MKNKNFSKIINIISGSLFITFTVISLILVALVISLGVLPGKYLAIGLIIGFLLYSGLAYLTFVRKNNILKTFLSLLCVGLIVLCLFVFEYLNSTLHFMDKIKATNYQTENYYVLVESDSKYNTIEDISIIGFYNTPLSKYEDALNKLAKTVNLLKLDYSSYTNLIDALESKEVDAILISSANKDVITELVDDFEDKTKIIYTMEIKTENNIETTDINVTQEAFNIYVSGIDIYGKINSVSRSDVNMIITVNPKTNQVLLTSIPRDYYVQLHGTSGSKDKLTHAGLYGIDMSINTIEDLLDIEIDYYVRVNFTTLVSLVDAIGGIEVYSDTAVTAWTDRSCHFPVGNVKLNGKCALAYSRERYGYRDGDRHRVRNQQDVIKAILKKALSSKTLITRYTQILESMSSSFQTNMPSDKIYDLINNQLNTMPNWDFYSYSLNGSDSSNVTYSFGSQILYVMEPNISTVNIAKEKINSLMKD